MKFLVSSILIIASLYLMGCSGTGASEEDYTVYKKKGPSVEYSSISGIEKKSLINQSNLELLTNIISEYKSSTIDRDAVMTKIIELINTPYLWGGTSTYGIDCSAFVQTVFKMALNIDLPRTSIMQSTVGEEVKREDLRFGDLIFFNTMGRRISHVGIYLGESVFAHSSSSGGVKTSSLNEDYYSSRFVTARRVIK
ncbi:MAG: C40 family peptidase [Ignavibacteria bacterium]